MAAVTLASLLDYKHSIPPALIRALGPEDRGTIVDSARRSGGELPRGKALRWLAMLGGNELNDVLRGIFEDPNKDEVIQSVAVEIIARIGGASAEDLERRYAQLIASARSPVLRARIATLLGRVGTSASLPVLDLLARDESSGVSSRAQGARSLLRQRIGLPTDEMDDAVFAPVGDATPVPVTPATSAMIEEAFDHINWFLRDVEFDTKSVDRMECQSRELLVFKSRALANNGGEALKRGGMLALIAGRDQGDLVWEVDWLIGAQPDRTGRAIIGRTPSGAAVWAGHVDQATRTFELRTLSGKGPTVSINVTISDGRAVVGDIRRWDAKLAPRKSIANADFARHE
ncbi:MAG TPA: hypothetical protein VFX97_15455 [Pyrinomonadaceae bacterium]|nr:hypothetical protein [Pyrinomonadaceae bacterium]